VITTFATVASATISGLSAYLTVIAIQGSSAMAMVAVNLVVDQTVNALSHARLTRPV